MIRFIVHYNFTILFIAIELIALVLIVNHNPIQRGHLSHQFNSVSSVVYDANFRISRYLHLRHTNDQLARENSKLRSLVQQATADSTNFEGVYTYLPANVINNSIHKVHNYLTLDVGLEDGIEPDMGVISPSGIVGVVKSVTPNFSRVLSVLNTQLMISVKLAANDYYGSMVWTPGNYREVTVTEIPSHAPAEPGDTLVTSGYSSIFPSNLPVAIVISSSVTSDGNFIDVKARLLNDFKHLTKVYVVDNKNRSEILEVEELVK